MQHRLGISLAKAEQYFHCFPTVFGLLVFIQTGGQNASGAVISLFLETNPIALGG